MSVLLEIAVSDPSGIAAAARGGADRIELCTGLPLGGLTPSLGLIQAAVAGSLGVHVLVRPRAGGFEYTTAERAVILADAARAVDAGAAGVVVGATIDRQVDARFISRLRTDLPSVDLTFHRAFDTLVDRRQALDVLADLGVDRVLTSGGASRAPEATAELQRLVDWSAARIQVMAGGGITSGSVRAVAETGVAAIHASAKRVVPGPELVELGSAAAQGQSSHETTDEAEVSRLRAALTSEETSS